MHTKKQRTLAFITCAVFIIVTLFSILFIVKEADHDCIGKNCPVCACIHKAEQTLKQLETGDTGRELIVPDLPSVIVTLSLAVLFIPGISLISQKVRLNN